MTIIDDNIALTGDRILTVESESSVMKYIVFTATSVSEASELTITKSTQEEWNVVVNIVKCINDTNGKTFAIRIECPFFTTNNEDEVTRTVRIDGAVYTSDLKGRSTVHEVLTYRGCYREP